MNEKPQTPSQRVANPVWLRSQIGALVRDCDENIEEDARRASHARGDERAVYLARVESHRHWKRQLERVLRGKTISEDFDDAVAQEAR